MQAGAITTPVVGLNPQQIAAAVAQTQQISVPPTNTQAPPAQSTTVGGEIIPPNQTIYVNNLNEKVKKDELRKSLYALFSQYGPILDIVALKTHKMRGQAFIVFKDVASAGNAMRQMTNFPFYDKPMKIAYAKSQSDIMAKLNGTWTPRKPVEKRKAEDKEKKPTKKLSEKPKESKKSDLVTQPFKPQHPVPSAPNKILFVENLPARCNEMMLAMLFQQYPGFKEVRMVPGKEGIAFVEFEDDLEASVAMSGLQHFKITPENLMLISFARK